METAQSLHTLLHTLWTKAVGTEGYNKEEWKRLSAFIYANIDATKLHTRAMQSQVIKPSRPSRYERKPVI